MSQRAHSTATYSQPQQERFISGWFKEWSSMQRADFAPVLAQAVSPGVCVNGLIGSLERLGRPPSIFQCQVRLFQQWSDSWTQQQRQQLCQTLGELDRHFARLLATTLSHEGSTDAQQDSVSLDVTPEPPISVDNTSLDSQTSELTPADIM